jgi:glycolate oxidase
MARACESAGATFVADSSDPAEGELLMAARRLAYPALERQGAVLADVAVPIARIPDLLREIEGTAAPHEVLIGTFGHAGDGNMHPTIVFDHRDVASIAAAFEDIVHTALRLGGSITGEHGVGLLKRRYLGEEIGEPALHVHRTIKQALDPGNILNPGKVL